MNGKREASCPILVRHLDQGAGGGGGPVRKGRSAEAEQREILRAAVQEQRCSTHKVEQDVALKNFLSVLNARIAEFMFECLLPIK